MRTMGMHFLILMCAEICDGAGAIIYAGAPSTCSSFLWDHWANCCIFKNGVPLMHTLEGVSSIADRVTAYEVSQ